MNITVGHHSIETFSITPTLVPTGLTASDGAYTDKVRLTWGETAGASGYEVFRSISSLTSEASVIANSSTTNYNDISASVGQQYYYWVKATNAYGASAFSPSNSGWRASISSGVCADYDGDRLADPAVYDEAAGIWKVKLSSINYYQTYYQIPAALYDLSGPGYASVSADYDGDAKADPAVYRELTGRWTILPSTLNYSIAIVLSRPLGGTGYSGIPADYDGDYKADPGVYQRENGNWRVMLSSADYYTVEYLGLLGGTGYRAIASNYDGDHKADPAVYQESDGLWGVMFSGIGYKLGFMTQLLGGTGWIPIPADYDGDGLADPAIRSTTGNEWIVMFSSDNYTPVPLTILFE